ncbi:family 10 glycosylhydrolase [Phormidium tenue FACHB-886]|nr:family 10 glycosylhydrolase [Phormidium tenue FACHB-886]
MDKIRGVWIPSTDSDFFDSRQKIENGIRLLADTGFNYIFPVVWNRGYTLYPSRVMHQLIHNSAGGEIAPALMGRDPLQEIIDSAQRYNIKVVPWFEYGFTSSYQQNGGRLLAQRPDWAARDKDGNLAKKNGFEWMNALDRNVQDFLLSLMLEVVQRYDVDGVQGDDRLPALPSIGGYDAQTKQRYRTETGQEPPNHPHDPAWLKWRSAILTDFLARLTQTIKAVKPSLIISMAPSPYPFGYKEYLQDYPTWMQHDLVDFLHPQLYRRQVSAYTSLLKEVLKPFQPNHKAKLMPGVLVRSGDYRIAPDDLWQCIQYNRKMGLQGEVLFFFEQLSYNNGELAKFLQKKWYTQC